MQDLTELDPQRQEQARTLAALGRRVLGAELGATVLVFMVLFITNAPVSLRDWATSLWPAASDWVAPAAYAIALGVVFTAISLPFDFYSGYVLPRRFGLLTQSFGGWALDTVKSLAIGAVFGLVAVELLYWLLRTFPEWWWAIMAALVWLFSVVMAQLAPVLLMPLFYKFRLLDDPELVARLTSLAERAGARVRGVYVMDMSSRTTAANAMLAGLGRTRRIILGDTLLANFTHDEIETVLAHELAHHVHNDLLRGLAAEAVIIPVGMWFASVFLSWGVGAFGFEGVADVAALPLFAVAMVIFGLLTMPLGNWLSRRREVAADLYALRTTGDRAAFRSVMLKLANLNLSDADPPAWVRFLFYSHPPVSERVRLAG